VARSLTGIVAMLCALGVLAPAASADHVGCGALIQADTTLDSDVVGCTGSALRVVAGEVDLDLGGHRVSSVDDHAIRLSGGGVILRNGIVDSPRPTCSVFATGPQGGQIRDLAAHDVCIHQGSGYLAMDLALSGGIRVTESTGNTVRDVSSPTPGQTYSLLVAYSSDTDVQRVRGVRMAMWSGARNTFHEGKMDEYCNSIGGTEHAYLDNECGRIQVDSTDDATIAGNTVSAAGYGITSSYNSGARISRNSVRAGIVGIQLYSSSDGTIAHNHVTGGQFGILLGTGSEGNVLVHNFARRAGDDGIDIRSPGNSLGQNRANHNGDIGINAVAGNIDLGGNKAHANGGAAQCVGVTCK
jgi:parallel beta-helix repeat protein